MYKSQNVTEVMQLNTVTAATHGSMPCAAQTQAQLPPHHATAIATRSATFCHGHDRATPTPANCLRRRGMVLIFVCGGARLHAAPLRGRRRYRDAKMRAPAAASGVPTRRHAPFAISSQARRRLGKELKPASRRASNACQRIESTRHVNESTFSEAWNPTYPCYKVNFDSRAAFWRRERFFFQNS